MKQPDNADSQRVSISNVQIGPSQRFFSLNDTARYLGLSRKTLYAWAERRKIPGYKVGRLWLFDIEELASFLKRNRYEAIV